MFYQGKNVLVLQGEKMFGRCLTAKLLEQGAAVRVTVEPHHNMDLAHNRLEVVKCDLSDSNEAERIFKDIDIVFMTANKSAGVKVIKENPHVLFMENIQMQPVLMQCAVKAGVQRVGFISSSYIYPDTENPNVEGEGFSGDPPEINYGIGWCFRYLETLCKHFHMTTKTRFAVIRPTAYYGPYDNFDPEQSFVIPALILKAAGRMNPYEVWGNGGDVRCFTYVDDLMEGFMLAVEKYAEAEGINICCEEASTVKQVVSLILEILDFRPEIRFSTDKPSAIPYKVSNPGQAKRLLGWQARVSLKQGLKQTIDWYLKRHAALSRK